MSAVVGAAFDVGKAVLGIGAEKTGADAAADFARSVGTGVATSVSSSEIEKETVPEESQTGE